VRDRYAAVELGEGIEDGWNHHEEDDPVGTTRRRVGHLRRDEPVQRRLSSHLARAPVHGPGVRRRAGEQSSADRGVAFEEAEPDSSLAAIDPGKAGSRDDAP
jgi:hypothetical protein